MTVRRERTEQKLRPLAFDRHRYRVGFPRRDSVQRLHARLLDACQGIGVNVEGYGEVCVPHEG